MSSGELVNSPLVLKGSDDEIFFVFHGLEPHVEDWKGLHLVVTISMIRSRLYASVQICEDYI